MDAGRFNRPLTQSEPIYVGGAFETEDVRVTPAQPAIESASIGGSGSGAPRIGIGNALVLRLTIENKSGKPLPRVLDVALKDPTGNFLRRAPAAPRGGLQIEPNATETAEFVFRVSEKQSGEYVARVTAPSQGEERARFEFRFKL